MNTAKYRCLLIVDDEPHVINSLVRELHGEKYNILTAASAEVALQLIRENRIGVIMSDLVMPGMNGITFLSHARRIDSATVHIVLTAHGTIESIVRSVTESPIFKYIAKPWSQADMRSTIAAAFEAYEAYLECKGMSHNSK
jgi:DNA-binding NtrC family response regulator